MAIDYYRLLGVPPDADRQRLKSAYRSLAKRFHPDTNNGCEASSDLFRQINAAYRVLCDPKLRAEYDARQRAEEQAAPRQPTKSTPAAQSVDPQQKFNRFVDSLLDAIFGPLEQPATKQQASGRPPPQQRRAQVRRKPAFSFYYHLEMEKHAAPYAQCKDGIYRQVEKRKAREPTGKRRGFRRAPGDSFLLLLLISLSTLLNP